MRPHLAVGLPLWATQYIAQGGRTVTLGLEPRTAEELAELLARGVVIAEGVMDPEGRVGFGRSERAEPRKGVSPGRREGISATTHERRPIVETPPQPPKPEPPEPEPPMPGEPEPPQG